MKKFIAVSLLALAFSGCSVSQVLDLFFDFSPEKQCESGDANTCIELAKQYESRWRKIDNKSPYTITQKDYDNSIQFLEKSKYYLQKACKFNDANACYKLEDYQKACDLSHKEGCKELADAYKWGRGAVKQDLRKAQEYYEKSGSNAYEIKRYLEQLPSYEKSCELNNANACLTAVEIHINSTFIEGYETNAKPWYEKAAVLLEQECKQGNNKSCTDLITLYTKFNLPKATELLEQACNRGDNKSCSDLTTLYLEFNLPRATKLLEQACKRGDNEACFDVATLYYEKKEVQNLSKALAFFDTACKRGDNTACFNVAIFYNEGKGTQINLSKAKEYYHKACNTGIQKACEKLMAITNIGIQ